MEGPGSLHIEEIGRTLTLSEWERTGGQLVPPLPWGAFLDAEKVRFPLAVRNVRPGDRFVPLGMKGHKKLKDFFVDLKVPLSRKKIHAPSLPG